ncbi:MAG: hypothetical protein U9N57_05855, partial [Pseudomonadota bacterium]|nr:hypothetical protein [Pseudomonadota bacterium]
KDRCPFPVELKWVRGFCVIVFSFKRLFGLVLNILPDGHCLWSPTLQLANLWSGVRFLVTFCRTAKVTGSQFMRIELD